MIPELRCLESGQWDLKVHQCEADCGITLIGLFRFFHLFEQFLMLLRISAENTTMTLLPWHVGIYKNGEQICGGTIISERVVISAAHCFSVSTNNTHVIDYKIFKVAAGKARRDLLKPESPPAQIKDIQEVIIPRM